MKTRHYDRAIRAAPLLATLLAAGVPVLAVRPDPTGAPACDIDLGDAADDAAVDATVAAQDVAAIDQAAQAAAQQFLADKATLKAFQTLVAPTAVDIVKALRAQTRMLARLALADN